MLGDAMRTPSSTSRTIGALLLAGALALVVMLPLHERSSDRSVEPLAPHTEDAVNDSLLPIASGEATSRTSAELAAADEPALEARAITRPGAALTRFDYGVRGQVKFAAREPRYMNWQEDCTITAVNVDGDAQSGLIKSRGRFGLFELGPGRWTVEVDLGGYGKAIEVVELSPRQPQVELVMWVTPAARIGARIVLLPQRNRAHFGEDYNTRFAIAAHRGPTPNMRTKLDGLPPLSSAFPRAQGNSKTEELFLEGELRPPLDEPLTISLFVDGLWVASRPRAAGEEEVEWLLEPGTYPLARGSLALTLLDASTGAPLPDSVWLPNRRHNRLPPEGKESVLFGKVPPGWLSLEAGGGTHERVWRSIFIAPGERIHETIRLAPTVTLAGRVTGPDDTSLAVALGAWKLDESKALDSPVYAGLCTSNVDGQFAFDSLGPGSYLVRSFVLRDSGVEEIGESTLASRIVVVDATVGRTDVVVQLEPFSTLLLSLATPDGAARAWKVLDQEGRFLHEGIQQSGAPRRLDLPNGRYTVVREPDGAEALRIPVGLTPTGSRVEL